LKQTNQNFKLSGSPIQVVIGELAPPGFSLASNLFPLALDNIFIHVLILRIILESCLIFLHRSGQPGCAGF
jgi:hypothetical protein